MPGMRSRNKGKRGEREAAAVLNEVLGACTRRGVQFAGRNESGENFADVVGLEGVHIEVKRVEKLNLAKAVEQSTLEAPPSEAPVVLHRRNNEQWLLTVPLRSLPGLVDAINRLREGGDASTE